MVQLTVFDLIRTTCGGGCQNMSSCWQGAKVSRGSKVNGSGTGLPDLFTGSPRVIKSNNPEVMAKLGDENCFLVCDLEIDSIDGEDWVITWYKMRPNGVWDKEIVSNCVRCHLAEDKLSLRIENVLYEDRGIYRCEVINSAGKFDPCSAEFNVIVVPQDDYYSDGEDGRVRIRIDQTPICCKVGEKVSMMAVIENRPRKLKVDWYKMQGLEEIPLNKRRIKINQSKVHSQAKIKSITPQDAGVYRVKAVSPGDYATGHIVVNVNTENCEVEIEEIMKRAFSSIDIKSTGILTPSQVRDTMTNLGLTVPHGCVDDIIYLAVDTTGKMVHYQTFIDKVIYQYKSEMA